jgi:hypothetical protein
MDALMKLSREAQGVLVGTVLFVILSFLDWQQATVDLGPLGSHSVGENLWHGFGVIVALVAIVLLAWEIIRTLDVRIELGGIEPGVISTGLAFALAILTIIIFLDWSDFRHWPMYLGTLLAIGVGVLAFFRARKEGVGMPAMPSGISVGGGGTAAASAGAAAPAAPVATPASPPPAAAPIADPAPPPPADPAPDDPAPDAPAEV